MLYLLLIGCESSVLKVQGTAHTSFEQAPKGETIGNWELGTQLTCDSPAASPSWIDASDSLFGSTREGEKGQPAGGMGLFRQDQQWMVAITAPHDEVRWRSLDGSEAVDMRFVPNPVHLHIDDFDGDGEVDALAFSHAIQIGWSFATDHAQWDVLLTEYEQCTLRDIAVFDIEGDGDLDLIVPGMSSCGSERTWAAALLRNNGDRSFGEAEEMGLPEEMWGVLFDAMAIDIDDDSDLDLYMCNDFGNEYSPNGWLMNAGDGTFYEGENYFSDVVAHCMGVSFADLNQDGLMDIYVAGNQNQFLLINSPAGWVESSAVWNMPAFDNLQMAWGSIFTDFDNDGLIDLMVSTSDFARAGSQLFPIWAMRQSSPGWFEEVSVAYGFAQETTGRAIISRDLNGDGVVDFIVADAFGDPWFYLSQGCTIHNWLAVETPRSSIVEVEAGGKTWTLLASTDPGFAVTQPAMVHVGLGSIDTIDKVTVKIPYQGEAVLYGPISARRTIRISGLDD